MTGSVIFSVDDSAGRSVVKFVVVSDVGWAVVVVFSSVVVSGCWVVIGCSLEKVVGSSVVVVGIGMVVGASILVAVGCSVSTAGFDVSSDGTVCWVVEVDCVVMTVSGTVSVVAGCSVVVVVVVVVVEVVVVVSGRGGIVDIRIHPSGGVIGDHISIK